MQAQPPRVGVASSGPAHRPSSRKPSGPRPQPSHSPEELHFAKLTLQKLVQDSTFFPDIDKNNSVQTIREDLLDIGTIIGKGGFCEVRCASLNCSTYGRHPQGASVPKYAMKYLSPSKTSSSRVFQRGIADLAMEACFLSLLRHENIIGLHYVSEGSLEENFNCAVHNHYHHHHHQGSNGGGDQIVMDAHGNLHLQSASAAPPPPPPPPTSSHFFGYFLLLDPLHETLTDRIEKTYVPEMMSQSTGGSDKSNMFSRIRHKHTTQPSHGEANPKAILAQRLETLRGIASALRYLHDDCKIVFRDVKPDNIGFYRRYHPQCSCGCFRTKGHREGCTCYDEVTKLFDFGLAKELKPKYRKRHPAYPDQDTFKLTGCTGSRRYMAPEVCFSDPYNQKADVYSFGMLLYQVASLVTPFDGFSMGKHEQVVLRGGYRPDVNIPNGSFLKGKKSQRDHSPEGIGNSDVERKNNALASKTKRSWPKELPRLMEECWDYDMRYRPDMKEVSYRLERCVDDLLGRQKGAHGGGHHWPKFNPLHHHGKGDGRHSPPVQAVAAMVSKGVGRNGGSGAYSSNQAVYHHQHHQANRSGNAGGQPMDMQWEGY